MIVNRLAKQTLNYATTESAKLHHLASGSKLHVAGDEPADIASLCLVPLLCRQRCLRHELKPSLVCSSVRAMAGELLLKARSPPTIRPSRHLAPRGKLLRSSFKPQAFAPIHVQRLSRYNAPELAQFAIFVNNPFFGWTEEFTV
eukprot:1078283-Pyramimonas_sp.AAC.1